MYTKYHAKSVLLKDFPSSITPELRSRRILCRLLVQQYLVRTSTRYQHIFISGMHKSRRVSSTAVHQQPCRVSDRQYEYVTVVSQQYVRYTKNETIAAAAAAAAAARSSSNSKPSNLGNKQSSLSLASRPTPDPMPRQHRSHPTHHHRRCYHCRSEAPQLALVELATLPRDCRTTPTDWSL